MSAFSDRLIELRKESGLSQEKFAECMGVSRDTVSRWENDHVSPDLEELKNIAALLDCDCGYLIGESQIKRVSNEQISETTGLSYETVETLSRWNNNAFSYVAQTIDLLVRYHADIVKNQVEFMEYNLFSQLRRFCSSENSEISLADSTLREMPNDVAEKTTFGKLSVFSDDLQLRRIEKTLTHIKEKSRMKNKNNGYSKMKKAKA